jgi:hypothetical protein
MALPDDGRTDYADFVTIGNGISASIGPAVKAATVGLNLVSVAQFPTDANSIKWRKSGALTAEVVAEGAAYTPTDANSDITDTSVTTTAVKVMVSSPITAEAMRFGAGGGTVERFSGEQGRAISRKFDADLFALFTGASQIATAASAMDADTLLLGQFNLEASEVPLTRLAAVLSAKQIHELRLDAKNTTGASYMSQVNLSILGGTPQANNFVGNYLGIDIYRGFGLPTVTTRTAGAIFDTQLGFCCGVGGTVETQITPSGQGVVSAIPAASMIVTSYWFYDVKEYYDQAVSQLRSNT